MIKRNYITNQMNINYFTLCFVAISPFIFMSIMYYLLPKRIKYVLVDEKNRYQTIDGLRGIAAICVMFVHSLLSYHFLYFKTWWDQDTVNQTFDKSISSDFGATIYSLGGFGVCIFFMITGFLFYDKLIRSEGHINIKNFFIKRFFRISPLYYFVILSVFITVLITGLAEFSSLKKTIKSFLSWLCFYFVDIKTISSIAPGSIPLAGVIWTLKVEWIFYFCVPFLSLFNRKKIVSIAFVLLGLATVIILYKLKIIVLTITIMPFFLGMLASLIANNYIKINKKILVNHITSFIILLITIYSIFLHKKQFVYCLLLGLVFIAISNGNSIFGILKTKILISLGSISYSIYLIHGLVLFLINLVFLRNGSYLLNTLITIFLTLFVSIFTFYFIERTGVTFGAKITKLKKVDQ